MIQSKKSGKEATKGSKQIKEENLSTYVFYQKTIVSVLVFTLFCQYFWWADSLSWVNHVAVVVSLLVYLVCIYTIKSMVTSNLDVNAGSGVAEHIKDIFGITIFCQMLSNFSLYFLLLWFIIPIVAMYKLWTSVIAPWIFQEGPPELTEKQKRKMERKTYKRY